MVRAALAPVRPRVWMPATGHVLPLEEALQSLLEAGESGPIEIAGSSGAGKTTALQHLAYLFFEQHEDPGRDYVLLDDAHESDVRAQQRCTPKSIIVFASNDRQKPRAKVKLRLSLWSDDDIIEYLLNTHPKHCRAIMQRVTTDSFRNRMRREPLLWRTVLDELSEACWEATEENEVPPQLPSLRDALRAAVKRLYRKNVESRKNEEGQSTPAKQSDGAATLAESANSRDYEEVMEEFCLQMLASAPPVEELHQRLNPGMSPELARLIRSNVVLPLLAADGFMRAIRHNRRLEGLPGPEPDWISEVADQFGEQRAHVPALQQWYRAAPLNDSPALASILFAVEPDWRPGKRATLRKGLFEGAQWAGVSLEQADLSEARLEQADLQGANLTEAHCHKVNLNRSRLDDARVDRAVFSNADFEWAELPRLSGPSVSFDFADFTDANLEECRLAMSCFLGAKLHRARLFGAVLTGTLFVNASVAEADFRDADLSRARLSALVMKMARWEGCNFKEAFMREVDLEFTCLAGTNFQQADLRRSWLTGTSAEGVSFQKAGLRGAGLADIDWPRADLRHADLTDCVFHLGSTRSGLVGSPYPSHGTRTGFYTDTYDDRYHKAPEEIRKANLCGADLRGAKVTGTDFYLVDLRGAIYDEDQQHHFRRCHAIMDDFESSD